MCMTLIELLCSPFAIGNTFLLSGLIVDCDFVLDVLDSLVDLCWSCRWEEVDLLELVNSVDVVGEIFIFLFFLLGWLLMFGLLFLVCLALLGDDELGTSLELLLPLLSEDNFSCSLLAVVNMVLDWLESLAI